MKRIATMSFHELCSIYRESHEINEKIESMKKVLDKDGIPICFYCGKKMKPWTPTHGKFKGQKDEHLFKCDCERYPENLVINVG